jgi:3-deoxy-D-manno-octulosonate 8-phosphate phosphatase (KDO 8-P phosphatase)
MEGLGVKHHYQGQSDKNIKMQQILETLSLNVDQVAFVGDDVMDLTVMKKIALPIAVANAHPFVKEHALLITENRGGNGAVREVCDCLLKAHSKYDDLMKSYL